MSPEAQQNMAVNRSNYEKKDSSIGINSDLRMFYDPAFNSGRSSPKITAEPKFDPNKAYLATDKLKPNQSLLKAQQDYSNMVSLANF